MSGALAIIFGQPLGGEMVSFSAAILDALRDAPEVHAFTDQRFPPKRILLAAGLLRQLQSLFQNSNLIGWITLGHDACRFHLDCDSL
jgi:hypothetical protein